MRETVSWLQFVALLRRFWGSALFSVLYIALSLVAGMAGYPYFKALDAGLINRYGPDARLSLHQASAPRPSSDDAFALNSGLGPRHGFHELGERRRQAVIRRQQLLDLIA